jgi:hypothetical protein
MNAEIVLAKMTDNKDDVVVHRVFGPAYRRFLSPEELRARREAEACGVLAEVVQLREDQTGESCNSEISPSLNNTSAT